MDTKKYKRIFIILLLIPTLMSQVKNAQALEIGSSIEITFTAADGSGISVENKIELSLDNGNTWVQVSPDWNTPGESVSWNYIFSSLGENMLRRVQLIGSSSGGAPAYSPIGTYTIEDTVKPTLLSTPEDLTYFYDGMTIHTLEWIVEDLVNDTYSINGIDQGNWTSNQPIHYHIPIDLLPGNHTVNFTAYDTSGNDVIHSTNVTIIDTMNPVIQCLNNSLLIDVDSVNNYIEWEAFDYDPLSYQIEINGNNQNLQLWDGGNITLNIDDLPIGHFVIKCIVKDEYGNQVENTTLVDVFTPKPLISLITSIESSYNSSLDTLPLSWTINDDEPGNLEIYIDETLDEQFLWEDLFIYNLSISNLSYGTHNITLIANDSLGNWQQNQVSIVKNNLFPTFLYKSENLTLDYNDFDSSFEWVVIDDNPTTYSIFHNGEILSEYENIAWISGETVSFGDFSGFSLGNHSFSIEFKDIENEIGKYDFHLNLVDLTEPIIGKIEDFNIDEGKIGEQIKWDTYDDYPKYYEIYLGDMMIENGTWSMDSKIITPLDGLKEGNYEIKLVLFDQSDNIKEEIVRINVRPKASISGFSFGILIISSISIILYLSNRKLIDKH